MAKKIVAVTLVEPYKPIAVKLPWRAHPTSGNAWKGEVYIDLRNEKRFPDGVSVEQGPAGLTMAVPGERARILLPWAMINGIVFDDEPFAEPVEPAKK